MTPKEDQIRELPISLQGIEIILRYLREQDKDAQSIRNISKETNLSMRVVKNILLQLEKFNQIERVVEKNNILPKWRITKLGKTVIKEVNGKKPKVDFLTKEDELIHDIVISSSLEELKQGNKQKQENITSKLGNIQTDLSKTLGPVLNLNDPIFEELLSFLIKRVKFLKQQFSNAPVDPIASHSLKKMGEKQKKVSKEEEKFVVSEIYFLNSIIFNQLKRIADFNNKLTQMIENDMTSSAFSMAKDLREEIRLLSSLVNQKDLINVNSHILSSEELKKLTKNNISSQLLDNIIEIPMNEEMWTSEVKSIMMKFISMINKGERQLADHNTKITDNIPLFALYNLILDEKPRLNVTIEQFERAINSLADDGVIPGIKIIQEDEDHYIKVLQLKARDISEEETTLISHAVKLQKFTLADIVKELGWSIEKTTKILNVLTDLGILKYSKSFLHGELWYIVSNQIK